MVKPFTNEEALGDPHKHLFNLRLSGLRAEGSENIFGMWKMRLPIIKHVKLNHDNAMEAVFATAVLHNYCVHWNEPELHMDGEDEIPDEFLNFSQGQVHVVDDLDPVAVRAEGEIVRNRLLANMPPPTSDECKMLCLTS